MHCYAGGTVKRGNRVFRFPSNQKWVNPIGFPILANRICAKSTHRKSVPFTSSIRDHLQGSGGNEYQLIGIPTIFYPYVCCMSVIAYMSSPFKILFMNSLNI